MNTAQEIDRLRQLCHDLMGLKLAVARNAAVISAAAGLFPADAQTQARARLEVILAAMISETIDDAGDPAAADWPLQMARSVGERRRKADQVLGGVRPGAGWDEGGDTEAAFEKYLTYTRHWAG